jgi:hypothetical protein
MTPSVSQVRQPVHSRSVGQWRNYTGLLDIEMAALEALDT